MKYVEKILIKKLSQENSVNNEDGFQRFCDISLATLKKHAASKTKHFWGNRMPFFNKELSKARNELWHETNYAIISYMGKIESFMQNKDTFVSLF